MTAKEINWETVDAMLIAGCDGVQCAAAIGVCSDTLYDRCLKEKGYTFSVYRQQKRSHGDGLLHAAQFQKAYKDKNPTMLIWLGKQRLNQKELQESLPINDQGLAEFFNSLASHEDYAALKEKLSKAEAKINELECQANTKHSASDEEVQYMGRCC